MSATTAPRVDTIVRGGRVVTASDVFEAAIAIKGDKIAAIGPADAAAARRPRDRRPAGSTSCPDSSTATCTSAPNTTTGRRPARRRPHRPDHAPAVRTTTRAGDPAHGHGAPARGGERAVRPRFRLSLHPEPRALHPRRHPRGVPAGRDLVQAVHDVQEAAEPDGLRRLHRRRPWSSWGALGGALPAPLRERRRPLLPRGQGHRRRARRAPPTFPPPARTGPKRRRSTAPSSSAVSPAARSMSCISHAARPRAHQAGAGRGPEGVDRDLPAVPAPLRTRRWSAWAPSPRSGRRCGPTTARTAPRSGRDRGGLHRHGGERPLPAACPPPRSRGRKNIFVDAEGKPIPFGAPSLETLVPLVYSEGVVKRGLPITWMARVLAENPARIFGLYPRKGVIRVGADADLWIWDEAPDLDDRARAAPRHRRLHAVRGLARRGQPWMTLLRGQVLLNNEGVLEQKPGHGHFSPGRVRCRRSRDRSASPTLGR